MKTPTDTERLNFLQSLNDRKAYTGKVILRESITGRGWRLHETEIPGAVESVRDAIDAVMGEREDKGKPKYGKNALYNFELKKEDEKDKRIKELKQTVTNLEWDKAELEDIVGR